MSKSFHTKIVAKSQAELAIRLGCSQPTVSRWMLQTAWHWGSGPWTSKQMEEILRWRASVDNGDPLIRRAKIQLLAVQLKNLELDVAMAEGQYVFESEVMAVLDGAMFHVRMALRDLAFRNGDNIVGRPVEEIESVLAKAINKMESEYTSEIQQAHHLQPAIAPGGAGTASQTQGGSSAQESA